MDYNDSEEGSSSEQGDGDDDTWHPLHVDDPTLPHDVQSRGEASFPRSTMLLFERPGKGTRESFVGMLEALRLRGPRGGQDAMAAAFQSRDASPLFGSVPLTELVWKKDWGREQTKCLSFQFSVIGVDGGTGESAHLVIEAGMILEIVSRQCVVPSAASTSKKARKSSRPRTATATADARVIRPVAPIRYEVLPACQSPHQDLDVYELISLPTSPTFLSAKGPESPAPAPDLGQNPVPPTITVHRPTGTCVLDIPYYPRWSRSGSRRDDDNMWLFQIKVFPRPYSGQGAVPAQHAAFPNLQGRVPAVLTQIPPVQCLGSRVSNPVRITTTRARRRDVDEDGNRTVAPASSSRTASAGQSAAQQSRTHSHPAPTKPRRPAGGSLKLGSVKRPVAHLELDSTADLSADQVYSTFSSHQQTNELHQNATNGMFMDPLHAPVTTHYVAAEQHHFPALVANEPSAAYAPAAASAIPPPPRVAFKTDRTYEAVQPYVPTMEDEAMLDAGHQVYLNEVYADGWCKILNYVTGQEGVVPLSLLGEPRSMTGATPTGGNSPRAQVPVPIHQPNVFGARSDAHETPLVYATSGTMSTIPTAVPMQLSTGQPVMVQQAFPGSFQLSQTGAAMQYVTSPVVVDQFGQVLNTGSLRMPMGPPQSSTMRSQSVALQPAAQPAASFAHVQSARFAQQYQEQLVRSLQVTPTVSQQRQTASQGGSLRLVTGSVQLNGRTTSRRMEIPQGNFLVVSSPVQGLTVGTQEQQVYEIVESRADGSFKRRRMDAESGQGSLVLGQAPAAPDVAPRNASLTIGSGVSRDLSPPSAVGYTFMQPVQHVQAPPPPQPQLDYQPSGDPAGSMTPNTAFAAFSSFLEQATASPNGMQPDKTAQQAPDPFLAAATPGTPFFAGGQQYQGSLSGFPFGVPGDAPNTSAGPSPSFGAYGVAPQSPGDFEKFFRGM